ncbi:membrane dipeptidase [Pedobacter agri]|uniref:membrane dipeptidase n=1 Tax=Pedobacter agri TaxID=454586 RepID=UPI00277F5FCB|nr:membrane dipeptidase [Pedobacter agri]MDQ1142232.1 microsomal dipeptidase-like Zn-dependent dipeptidase [Pedobacter agri]
MAFFDLHSHPGLKTLFLPQNGNQLSAWRTLSPKDGILGNILESQASLKLLFEKGNINLICLTLHPPEIGMIDQVLLKIAAKFLFPTLINADRLREMYTLTASYQETFHQEFLNITAAPRAEDDINPAKKLKLLTSIHDYNPEDFDTLHIVLNIEGGHTFYDLNNRVKDIEKVIDNFNAFVAKGYKILYFTPTHLTPNEFITHAYGNKILTKGPLLPKGIGFSPYGKRIVENAYQNGVLIDIKHMSLVSRKIFYQLRKKGYLLRKPIIASHVGLVGNSWNFFNQDVINPIKKSYGYKVHWLKNAGIFDDTYFYPLSINLYNEDVREILESDGLIGLSLDVRILGGKDKPGSIQKDFYSHEEFELLMSENADQQIELLCKNLQEGIINNGDTKINANNPEPEDLEDLKEGEDELNDIISQRTTDGPFRKNYNYHLRLVVNHLLRIYQITEWEDMPLPWNNLCIGSDFDGLVEAIDCCRNVTEFDSFALALTKALDIGAKQKQIDLGLSAEKIVAKLMYENAVNFMQKNLT